MDLLAKVIPTVLAHRCRILLLALLDLKVAMVLLIFPLEKVIPEQGLMRCLAVVSKLIHTMGPGILSNSNIKGKLVTVAMEPSRVGGNKLIIKEERSQLQPGVMPKTLGGHTLRRRTDLALMERICLFFTSLMI